MREGRPSNAEISKVRDECYQYYKDFKSVTYTADKTGHSRATVAKHFKKFGKLTLEQDREKFIQQQKITKDKIIYKLELMIARGEMQLKRLEQMAGVSEDDDDENNLFASDMDVTEQVKLEALMNKVQGDLINWNQQKAGIEDTATLDVKIEDIVEDRVRELDERESLLLKKEQEFIKKVSIK